MPRNKVPQSLQRRISSPLAQQDGTSIIQDAIAAAVPVVLNAAWPVGSIFASTVATNPATLIGIGTWVAYGTGRVLVGIDAGQALFDTPAETGGALTHVLTCPEIPVCP